MHYNLKFLSDFSDAAGLNELDPNLMGMIDTIVASHGRVFVGTWFSTFTGYIVSSLASLLLSVFIKTLILASYVCTSKRTE